MARTLGSGEYEVTIKVRMTRLMVENIAIEAKNQRTTAAHLIRQCIEEHLDPKKRLELILQRRSTPLERLIGQVYPFLDASQMDEYDGMVLNEPGEENLVSWLLERQKELDIPLQ